MTTKSSPLDIILARFEKLSAIPRITKHEAQLAAWLGDWATELGFDSKIDEAGNLAIYVPASAGKEDAPTIILQGHMDMVGQKTPDSSHDFLRDPIHVIRDGDWLRADRTTLGADNGIAIAICMALAEDKIIAHPPLELLFTVEEEMGIGGASNLDPSLLSGKTLINLDSEEEGALTIGCSGGATVYMHLDTTWESFPANHEACLLEVGGLQGGHSGGDIHMHRGNSNKIMARILDRIQDDIPIQLISLKGGTVRNAIPREAQADFACPKDSLEACRVYFAEITKTIRDEYAKTDGGLKFSFTKGKNSERVISREDTNRAIKLITALPNGVSEMSAEAAGDVETSNNVGVVDFDEQGLHVTSNQRSSVLSRLLELTRRVEAIAKLAGTRFERSEVSHPWQPNTESPLLAKCLHVYESLYDQKPRVGVVHGGLECRIISERCNGIDAISFGPTILGPHSPDEKLYLPSVPRIWDFLTALLNSY